MNTLNLRLLLLIKSESVIVESFEGDNWHFFIERKGLNEMFNRRFLMTH